MSQSIYLDDLINYLGSLEPTLKLRIADTLLSPNPDGVLDPTIQAYLSRFQNQDCKTPSWVYWVLGLLVLVIIGLGIWIYFLYQKTNRLYIAKSSMTIEQAKQVIRDHKQQLQKFKHSE